MSLQMISDAVPFNNISAALEPDSAKPAERSPLIS